MKLKCVIFCILFHLSTYALAVTPTSLSLKDAVDLALSQNKEVKSYQKKEEQGKYELRSAYGKYFPSIGLEGRYVIMNDPLSLELGELRTAVIGSSVASANASASALSGNPMVGAQVSEQLQQQLDTALPAFKAEFQDKTFYTAAITLQQPIFTGGMITANKRAKEAAYELQKEQLQELSNRVVAEVVDRYMTIKLLEKVLVIRTDLVTSLDKHKNKADQLLKQGLLSKANYMRTTVAQAEARRELLKTQKDIELAKIAFQTVLGQSYHSGFEAQLTTDLFMTNETQGIDEYVKRAINNNANLKMLKHGENQLQQKKLLNSSKFLPQIALVGRYELHKSALTAMEPEWSVGVGAKWNVLQPGNYQERLAVTSELAALDFSTQHVHELIITEARKYYNDLSKAREQYESLVSSHELAKENLRLNEISFESGIATSLEIIDAQLALEKIKVEQYNAIYDFDVALVNLLRTCGDAKSILTLNKI